MVDRLGDLNIEIIDDDTSTTEGNNAEIAEHMQLYEPIKQQLLQITSNVKEIEKLKDKGRTVAKEKDQKKIMDELEQIMAATTKTGRTIKAQLDKIKAANIEYKQKNPGESAKTQARDNLYSISIRRFHNVMTDYNAASHDFKQGLQERTRRQLKIVDSNITDEEVESIVESGRAQDVISKALISASLQDTIRDIEQRHNDILKLERQVLEVYELVKDMATLVDLQQESLDVIESRITNAKAYVELGEKELQKAEHHQKQSRKKMCYLILCAVIILVAMTSGIIARVFKQG